jgi:hypothetical protein
MLTLVSLKIIVFSQNISDKRQLYRDSLTTKLKADSIHIFRFQKYRPYLNLDQRYSFPKDAPINVNGLQLGVLINNKHAVGLGGYQITEDARQKTKTRTDKDILVNRKLDMNYLTFFYQYTLIDRRFFELDLQAESGVGKYNLKFYDIQTNILKAERSAVVFVEGIGPQLTFKPFRWVGVNTMIGYRFTFEKNANLNFNGAYYSYGVWLDIRQIIRDCRYYLVKKPKYKKLFSESITN